MPQTLASLSLTSPDETAALAQSLAPRLRAGDVLLMTGGIGAGKTHFARSLIQSLLPEPEDVPSPTFTLVQVYEGPACEIWHSDLYRLSGPDEIEELGLVEAMSEAICLIEWPDRAGALLPETALWLAFTDGGEDTRHLTLSGPADPWVSRLSGVVSAVSSGEASGKTSGETSEVPS